MSAQSESPTGYGFSGRLNWLYGGAIGGVVGSLLFGGLLWVVDPTLVLETIPAIYGLESTETIGWTFHMLHGVVLGVVFGFVVSREAILGVFTAELPVAYLAETGPAVRLSLAGLVYGVVVWALLPVLAVTIWAFVGTAEPGLRGVTVTVTTLVGHLLYGGLLGALFSVFVDISPNVETSESPLETTDSP